MSFLSHNRDEEDQPTFWLEFQVLIDGAEAARQPAGSFPRFGDLPAELRLKIWGHVVQPRIVAAACLQAGDEEQIEKRRTQLRQQARRPAVPALLHVNREARDVGLAHYELAFAWRMPIMLSSGRASGGHDRPGAGARVWFDFARDCLLLLGELEPRDAYDFPAPMVYFLARPDTARVRHVACAFEALRYGQADDEALFGTLFHVVDRFPGARRLLITSTDADVAAHGPGAAAASLTAAAGGAAGGAGENVLSRIWRGWVNGTSVVTSSLADMQILMVREDELEGFIANHA